MRNLFFGVVTVAAVFAIAIGLLGTSGSAEATIRAISISTTTVDGGNSPGATAATRLSTITLDADEAGGNIRFVATSGTTANIRNSAVTAAAVGGSGTNDATDYDAMAVLAAGTIDINGSGTAGPACTDCLLVSTAVGGSVSILASGLTDDDNNGVAGPAVANGIVGVDQWDILAGGGADTDEDADVTSEAIAIAATNLDIVQADWSSPALGPGTGTITVIQGSSIKTVDVKYRGAASAVAVTARIQTAANTLTATTANWIRSTTASAPAGASLNAMAANIRATVTDSAGNGINAVTVSFTTDDGSLVDAATLAVATGAGTTATVSAARGISNTVSLEAGTTGKTGDTATVTANAGGKTNTTSVSFAGNAVACDITPADATIVPGGSTVITATFWSDTAKTVPIPDYTAIVGAGLVTADPSISAVNAAGAGTFVLTGVIAPKAGVMTSTLTAAAAGGTGVLATMGGTTVTCSNTVDVTAAVAETVTATGDGTIAGDLPSSGFGLVTFGGSIDELTTALAASCASGAPIFATSGGAFVGFFPTTSLDAPNAAFKALFTAGIPSSTPLLGGNC